MPSWIQDYVSAIDAVSESPVSFNIWAAISVISAALKKNVHITYKSFDVYPNQYIVLVGPPGVGKGVAIHPAHAFAKGAKLVNYMSDRVTAPRILEKLFQGFSSAPVIVNGQVLINGKDSTATLMSTELPTLIGSSEWMLQFLCDAWDKGEFDYDTKNKGSFTVSGMCVSLIGACVPDFIRRLSKDTNATVSSGFSARTIFVNAKSKSKSLPWGRGVKSDPKYQAIFKDLETRMQAIAKLSGEFKLTPGAIQLWDTEYSKLNLSMSEDDSDVYRNFQSRQHIHWLKVAMTLSASEDTSLIIDHDRLGRAIALVANVAEGVDEIFRGVGESDISSGIARLELYIERKGTVTFNELLNDNIRNLDHDDCVKIMKVLELIGFVTTAVSGNNTFTYTWTGKPINPNKGRP